MSQAARLTVSTEILAPLTKVWECYTDPLHIVGWNFASPDWHCPTAENDLRVGGKYKARMEAKDGSFGFDFEAFYTDVQPEKEFSYTFGGRTATVTFAERNGKTKVTVSFEPEAENSLELQQTGWQSILDNFAKYVTTTAETVNP